MKWYSCSLFSLHMYSNIFWKFFCKI